jgi:hypothetical protein
MHIKQSAQKHSSIHKNSQRQIKAGVPRAPPRPATAKVRTTMNSYKQFILQQQNGGQLRNPNMRQAVTLPQKKVRPMTARMPKSTTNKRKSQSKLGDRKTKATSS